jgi:hypothetical protein
MLCLKDFFNFRFSSRSNKDSSIDGVCKVPMKSDTGEDWAPREEIEREKEQLANHVSDWIESFFCFCS